MTTGTAILLFLLLCMPYLISSSLLVLFGHLAKDAIGFFSFGESEDSAYPAIEFTTIPNTTTEKPTIEESSIEEESPAKQLQCIGISGDTSTKINDPDSDYYAYPYDDKTNPGCCPGYTMKTYGQNNYAYCYNSQCIGPDGDSSTKETSTDNYLYNNTDIANPGCCPGYKLANTKSGTKYCYKLQPVGPCGDKDEYNSSTKNYGYLFVDPEIPGCCTGYKHGSNVTGSNQYNYCYKLT